MDLGLTGRKAIVMASSNGLGRACADSLAAEGVELVVNGRNADAVEAAVQELRTSHGVDVTGVVGDSADPETHDALLAACAEPDIVVLNGSGPPPTPFTKIEPQMWAAAAQRSMIAPLMFVQRVIEGMQARQFGRIVVVSSAMVKAPNPIMAMSAGPRLGLTAALKAVSKTAVKDNVTINSLLPERFDTGRQKFMAEVVMKAQGLTYDEARQAQVASIKAGRLGAPKEFGDTCAFLCSAQAGYISGQNVQLDGGSYEGVF